MINPRVLKTLSIDRSSGCAVIAHEFDGERSYLPPMGLAFEAMSGPKQG